MTHRLTKLRASIDEIDESLIRLLAERFLVTREVGRLKADLGLEPIDADREAQIEQKARRLALDNDLDADLVIEVLRSIIDRVVAEHQSLTKASDK
ncbi:MAG: chorismate mutase [Acidimicrobiales bacterium]